MLPNVNQHHNKQSSELYDQNFGVALSEDDLWADRSSYTTFNDHPFQPRWTDQGGASSVNDHRDVYRVNLDVQQFKPEEITVKVCENYLVIEGKHEEKLDKHGYISRHFVRRYLLPNDVQKHYIRSTLSSDGILTVTAPKQPMAVENSNERVIPIIPCDKPAIKQHEKTQ